MIIAAALAGGVDRMLLYRANLIHSATAYCGQAPAQKRMAAVFFWMA